MSEGEVAEGARTAKKRDVRAPSKAIDVNVQRPSAPADAAPEVSVARVTIGQLLRDLTFGQLWSVLGAAAVVIGFVATVSYQFAGLHPPGTTKTDVQPNARMPQQQLDFEPLVPGRVQFRRPIRGATIRVGEVFTVEGRVSSVPEGERLWIVHRRSGGDLGWPKLAAPITADGDFTVESSDFGGVGPLFVCVVSVDAGANRRFEQWLEDGRKRQSWPGLNVDVDGARELGCLEMHLQ